MNTICPHCKLRIPYSVRQAGQSVACPLCRTQFVMPTPDQQAKLIEEVDVLKREQTERFERARAGRSASVEEGRRYPALRFIAGVYQFLAVASLFLALVGLAAIFVVEMPSPSERLQAAAWLVGYVLIGPVLLWGAGELLFLLVDMANDIRATRQEITRLRRRKG
jgi:hypothetical protein